ncbi:MAG: hypothetical protein KGY99_03705 [Phycisphaerae bacterium]|nr:hypothetical protein [Phycisphaerae bacterium]
MALGFFYRHQKMVFIIMAVLMVSFLIGYQGFNLLFSSEPGEQTLGETRYGQVELGDLWQAQKDLRLLGLFDLRMYARQRLALQALQSSAGRETPQAYAMLLAEAEQSGVSVFDVDIERFLTHHGYGGENRQKLLADARNDDPAATLDRIEDAIRNWLMIYKTYRTHLPDTEPTERELQVAYRDQYEKIGLTAAVIRARAFRDDIPQTRRTALRSDEHVTDQFEAYRDIAAGTYRDEAALSKAFGFGYRQPQPRVRLLYAIVRRNIVRKVLGSDATEDEVNATVDAIAKAVTTMLADYAVQDPKPTNMLTYYEQQGLVGDGEDLLDRPLRPVHIAEIPLTDAVDKLAARAKPPVGAILIPAYATWLDSMADVSLSGSPQTLGAALDLLLASAVDTYETDGDPAWRWVTCRGLTSALFCVRGDSPQLALPVTRPLETGYLTWQNLLDPKRVDVRPLAQAQTAAKQGIAELVFERRRSDGSTDKPIVSSNEPGPDLNTPYGDRIVWRVMAYAPPSTPKEITPSIRRQVERDLLRAEAFKLARAFAADFRDEAAADGLEAAAEQAESVQLVDVEPFARKRWFAMRHSAPTIAWNRLGALTDRQWYPVSIRRKLIEAAFALADADAPQLAVVPFAPEDKVFVLKKAAHEPPARDEYRRKRQELANELRAMAASRAAVAHFTPENIRQRIGFTPVKP